jgi:putative hydrolase of HD superfamily
MPRTAKKYFGADASRKAETAAFADIVSPLTDRSQYLDLYDDYERRASLEARLVKAADVVDLLVQVLALERAGARGLEEFWAVAEESDFQLDGSAKEIVDRLIHSLLDARRELV